MKFSKVKLLVISQCLNIKNASDNRLTLLDVLYNLLWHRKCLALSSKDAPAFDDVEMEWVAQAGLAEAGLTASLSTVRPRPRGPPVEVTGPVPRTTSGIRREPCLRDPGISRIGP